MTNIDRHKGQPACNSDCDGPRSSGAGSTPFYETSAVAPPSGAQTKAVLDHLQHIQKKKKAGSALNDPKFLGAAMKTIYESSDVSIKRGDQTMVVTQLRDDEPTKLMVTSRPAPIKLEKSRDAEGSTKSPFRQGVASPDPFSSRLFIEPNRTDSVPVLEDSASVVNSDSEQRAVRSSSAYSLSDIVFWISLVIIFLGLAYWISP
ncbi:MAG: hypothetical protein JXA30_01530 [Deltaproteobacteria bacterium]|nr:hypothetical protein [Deltaproteobacteria bacterium]